RLLAAPPEIALVLGSGLGGLADAIVDPVIIPTRSLSHYPASTAPGHQGRLVFGTLEGRPVVCVQGRIHLYEGISVRRVVFPIRLVHALGARKLLVTNAAGGINRQFAEGDLMFITDHINFAFANPLAGPDAGEGPRFPSLSDAYDPVWRRAAEAAALQERIATQSGVYLWTGGPSYETRSEIRLYRALGADAVGMSTVPEVIQARYLGMSVLGLSAITNLATGMNTEPLRHEDVLAVGRRIRHDAERLVRAILRATT
ncbi:MAG: purine-nucleoside phosphorylase, partial [Rhodothermales bacterium]|nr:purine-nucleoside phosphorylase [Rhodothermales bacterium]